MEEDFESSEEVVQEEVNPEIEHEARQLGWVPEEDFRGDKSKWRSAEEFVERGREILPILKKNKEDLLAKNSLLEADLAEMKSTLNEFKEYRKTDQDRMYKQALADLKSKKKDAIESGDGELVVELDDAIDDLKTAQREEPAPKKPNNPNQPDPIFVQWANENEWYQKPALQHAANAAGIDVQELFPHLRGKEFLDKVTELVQGRYPEKFGNSRRSSASMAEGSGEVSGTRSKPKKQSYESMPEDARTQCDKFVKQKMLTKEEYVRDYWEQFKEEYK